jgi:hypothetical protein
LKEKGIGEFIIPPETQIHATENKFPYYLKNLIESSEDESMNLCIESMTV